MYTAQSDQHKTRPPGDQLVDALRELLDRQRADARGRQWHKQGVDALLAGPYGSEAHDLIEFLEAMTLESGPELVKRCGTWVDADSDTRFVVLSLIDRAIAGLRERHDLAPFDDALPFSDEKPTAFQIIRECLA